MRVPLFYVCALFALAAMVSGAPDRSALQTGSSDADSQPFVEEVIVESMLQVRSPTVRQARTNPRVNLQDGTRVYEAKRS